MLARTCNQQIVGLMVFWRWRETCIAGKKPGVSPAHLHADDAMIELLTLPNVTRGKSENSIHLTMASSRKLSFKDL